ncbi:restriction endonuclease subunit S [Paraprevotella clara]|uniref:restriction endonuclease subunit S n=1 Tax=Paraprevotella clara TaxID=454154 RepID=UPI00307E3415
MEKYKLGDIATVEISGVDKKMKDGEKEIRLCNFVDVYYNWAITTARYDTFMFASANPNEISKFQLKKGQVALTKDSETRDDIGIPTYIADDFDDVILGYHCALITPNKTILDGRYLNALLHTDYAKKYFACNASGSGQRYALSVEALNSFPVPIIPLSEQERIGEIFSALDKKIELNRQINQNLEAMAKQLYDYWFVQFDFPDEKGKPYKSSGGKMVWNETLKREIPKDWDVRTIKDFMRIFTGKKDVSKAIPGEYKFFSCAPEPITSNEYLYDGYAILVSGNGSYTGRVSFYKGKFDLYQRTYACVLDENSHDISFYYYTLKYLFQPIYSGGRHGSSIPYIVLGDLADFNFAYNVKVKELFINTVKSMFDEQLSKQREIEELIKQRDKLLPLLMNGQVSVNSDLSLG